ncbi:MAG: hypothetical protein H7246_10235 [Phycisphaerae bacterium]|nr:hypothetical protein [Saprospiraceae bacterium]
MHQSKLISLLSTLSPPERRRFKKWINSPIHNFNPTISKLYAFLENRSEWSPRSLQRERAFAAIYGKQAYDDLKMRRVMSEFLGVLEGFLAHESWRDNPSEQWLSLAKIYRQRQLPADATAYLNKAEETLNAQPLRDARYFLDHYRLQEERLAQNPARDSALNLQEMADELAHFFVAELLRNACSAASHAAIYRADYQLPYLEVVLADCTTGRYDTVPLIRLYFHSYQCLTEPMANEHFFAYKNLLPDAVKWLSKSELRDVLLFGINYCIKRSNMDTPGFLRELFDLYKLGLDLETFLENGLLSRFSYKNIVTVALKLSETNWVEQFLETYSPLLSPEFREHYERFCSAKLYYQKCDYGQVQTLLHDLVFDDVLLDLNARLLLLKIYFETSQWRLLQGFLTAFDRFVGRKKMLAYHAPNYRNIIQFTTKLMLWKSGKRHFSTEELENLRQQIGAAKPLTEREWLLEQL